MFKSLYGAYELLINQHSVARMKPIELSFKILTDGGTLYVQNNKYSSCNVRSVIFSSVALGLVTLFRLITAVL